jgi:hypothetical protein
MFAAKWLEKTKGAIKNGQSRETGYIEYTRRKHTKQKTQRYLIGQNVGHQYISD